MKYLVLGSEGQIGKHLVRFLHNLNQKVIEYDIKRSELEDLRLFGPQRELKGRILEHHISQCDFVFFLAWDVGGSKYLSSSEGTFEFINNNISIMKSTFELLHKYNKPFIFTSSQMANMGHSSYGGTKIMGERYTEALGGLFVRLWNVYGFERVNQRSHVITDFIEMALKNKVIRMRTDGSETRQFLYANDCCEALYTLSKLYDQVPRSDQLHVSSFTWTSVAKVAEIVCSICQCDCVPSTQKDDVQLSIQEEPSDDMKKYWHPQTTLLNGIQFITKQIKASIAMES